MSLKQKYDELLVMQMLYFLCLLACTKYLNGNISYTYMYSKRQHNKALNINTDLDWDTVKEKPLSQSMSIFMLMSTWIYDNFWHLLIRWLDVK